jgi:DNA-binding NarL/FixJ family response regulator
MTVQVVTNDVMLRRAVRRSLDLAVDVDVHAHSALAPPADVVVVDVDAPLDETRDLPRNADSGATIVVAPEIDARVREQGRRLDAVAYVRKDEGLAKVIGLVIELVSITGSA